MADRDYCTAADKNVYDKKGAETVRNKRFKEDRVRLRIYWCPDCKGWHLAKRREPYNPLGITAKKYNSET